MSNSYSWAEMLKRYLSQAPPMHLRLNTSPPSTSNRIVVNSGIKSSGMPGFSEEGSPAEWDTAAGEVYGYRWWKMHVPAELCGFPPEPYSWESYPPEPNYRDSPVAVRGIEGANGYLWQPGRQEARCTAGNHRPWPHEPPEYRVPCGCGFWAYFDPMLQVSDVISGLSGPFAPRCLTDSRCAFIPVFGVIKGTGRVIIGEKGFRSQYAEIVGLCVSDQAKYLLRATREWFPAYLYAEDNTVGYASLTEALRRYAAVEALLSCTYPGVKVFCDQQDMVMYFPPDKNYS